MKEQYTLVYITEFLVTDFIYELEELDLLESEVNLVVIDLSAFINKSFTSALSVVRASRTNIEVPVTWHQVLTRLFELMNTGDTKIRVYNQTDPRSIKSYIFNRFLSWLSRRNKIPVLMAFNNGVPEISPDDTGINEERSRFYKILSRLQIALATSSSPRALVRKATHFILRQVPDNYSSATHILVAGKASEEKVLPLFGTKASSLIRINAHSQDYSAYLRQESISHELSFSEPPESQESTAILLDLAMPAFVSDGHHMGVKGVLTSDVWYPALVDFFEKIEEQASVRVDIAGHYKTRHPKISPFFGGRYVYYGKTAMLVRKSKFVITISSTAVSYAVIYNKPVLFIYSDQLAKCPISIRNVFGMAALLDAPVMNINAAEINVRECLRVTKDAYDNYKYTYLTSPESSPHPNYKIIMEEFVKNP